MRINISRILAGLVLAACLAIIAGGLPARAQAPPPVPGPTLDPATIDQMQAGGIRLNFENIDISVLARIISQITGRNVILDQKVQGKITVSSSQPVSADQAWEMFVAALEAYGFGVEQDGAYFRVAPLTQTRQSQMRIYPNGKARVLVAVIRVERVPADQVVNMVRPLLSPTGVITGFANSNTIVVADDAAIVKRVVALAKRIDLTTAKPVLRIYYPRRVRAADVQKNLESLFPDRNRVRITVHPPTNSLLVLAPPEDQEIIQRLLASLERRDQVAIEARQFYVFYLQHAQAEDLAKIIGEMLSERQRVEQKVQESGAVTAPPTIQNSSPPGAIQPNANPFNAPVVPGNQGLQDGGLVAQSQTMPNVPMEPSRVAPFPSGAQTYPPISNFPDTNILQQSAQTGSISNKVSADKANNALVFYLTQSEYDVVRGLVSQLDIPRKQVLISCVIAEISLSRLAEAGISWQAITKNGLIANFGGQSLQGLLSILNSGQFVIGGVDPTTQTVNVGGTEVTLPRNYVLMQFLNTDNDFNLVSSPRLLTHNNVEANIKVGQVTPFATGARFDINGQPIINFDYREVGLDMTITPHISQEKVIRLEIKQKLQEIIDLLQQGVGAASFTVPVVSNREVNTQVSLLDGQTLIIGGLVQKRTLKRIRKIPVLGDIPGLGDLFFKQKREEQAKTTLFVFITPHIIDSPQKMKEITEQYNRYVEGKLRENKEDVMRQDYQPEKQLPAPVVDPSRLPVPGPAPTPESSVAPPQSPPQSPPPTAPQGPGPRTDRGQYRAQPGPASPWE